MAIPGLTKAQASKLFTSVENSRFSVKGATQTTWRAALANRAQAPAICWFIGDSITEGQGPASLTARWVARVRDLMRERFPTPGVTGGFGYLPAWYAATLPAQWAYGAPTGGQLLTGAGKRAQAVPAGGTATITVTGTSAKLLFTSLPGGGSFTYTVDGGAASSTISTNLASQQSGTFTTITLGAAGSHTVVITGSSGNSYVEGIMVYNGDEAAGIQFVEAAHSSYTTNDFATNPSNWTGGLVRMQPHMVVISLGTNDWTAGITPAQSKTNLLAIIAAIRATAPTNPSIVLMPVFTRNYTGSATPWTQFVDVQREIAAADAGISFLNLNTKMPAVLGDTLALYVDSVHPSAKGHALIGEIVTEFIGR